MAEIRVAVYQETKRRVPTPVSRDDPFVGTGFKPLSRDGMAMSTPIEDLDYLSRSPSRIRVLERLHEAPRSRHDLKEAVDASRTTLSRMLADFEDREWITRTDGRYRTTPEGDVVASEVGRLLRNMNVAEQLDGQLRWLPVDEFDFDLHRLQDAEVATLHWNDPASIRQLAGTLEGADRVKSIAAAVSRDVIDVLQAVTVEQSARYEGILAPAAIDIVRDHPELRRQLEQILASERTTIYEYRGDEPLWMVMLIDDTASICNHNSDSPHMEALLSDDEAFYAWCESYFDSVLAEAEPLRPNAFAQ